MKWHKTSYGEDYYLHQGSAIIISARVSPYLGNANQPKHEAWLWGAIIDNPGSLGVFDTIQAAKAEVEKRVKDSLEQIRKEIEA